MYNQMLKMIRDFSDEITRWQQSYWDLVSLTDNCIESVKDARAWARYYKQEYDKLNTGERATMVDEMDRLSGWHRIKVNDPKHYEDTTIFIPYFDIVEDEDKECKCKDYPWAEPPTAMV